MRLVRDVAGGAVATRRLLCREDSVRLGGAMLRGRYGGGGSAMLSLSETGFCGAGLRWFADAMETPSEVSMPVKYAPLSPEGIGPRIMGCVRARLGGGRK
jgi:hypothetical protein